MKLEDISICQTSNYENQQHNFTNANSLYAQSYQLQANLIKNIYTTAQNNFGLTNFLINQNFMTKLNVQSNGLLGTTESNQNYSFTTADSPATTPLQLTTEALQTHNSYQNIKSPISSNDDQSEWGSSCKKADDCQDDLNGVKRKNATRETTATLKAWLYEHRKNPYPSKGEKVMLAIITKMSLTQVSTWFANARRRLKKESRLRNKMNTTSKVSSISSSNLSLYSVNQNNQDNHNSNKRRLDDSTVSTSSSDSLEQNDRKRLKVIDCEKKPKIWSIVDVMHNGNK